MTNIIQTGFDTHPMAMQSMWHVVPLAPGEDAHRIFDAIAEIAPLVHGKTDRNGILDQSLSLGRIGR